jgi:hypothetical protein
MRNYLVTATIILLAVQARATQIKGLITNASGETLPHVSIRIQGINTAWSSNTEGSFSMILKPGTYSFTFKTQGYKLLEKQVEIPDTTVFFLPIIMIIDEVQLPEIIVEQDSRDRAKEIMKQVRDKRKDYLEAASSFTSAGYMKISTQREDTKWQEPDTTKKVKKKRKGQIRREAKHRKEREEDSLRSRYFRTDKPTRLLQIHLIESYGIVYYDGGDKYTEEITAWNDNKTKPISYERDLLIEGEFG